MTAQAQVPVVFDYSPYIEQSAYYEELFATEFKSTDVIAVWETNRGCPFKCSYCDWGSSTMSKVRRFDMERVRSEAEWFGKMHVSFVMLADANFGMLPRDVDITDLLIESNGRHGYPRYLSYNTAKNNPERTVQIARKLVSSGLAASHILSVQHTDLDVLTATERANISVEQQVEVVRQLLADDVPIYVQLILGIPGDTYEKWKRCFSDLMEWGIHSYYWIYPYSVLPNAPGDADVVREVEDRLPGGGPDLTPDGPSTLPARVVQECSEHRRPSTPPPHRRLGGHPAHAPLARLALPANQAHGYQLVSLKRSHGVAVRRLVGGQLGLALVRTEDLLAQSPGLLHRHGPDDQLALSPLAAR